MTDATAWFDAAIARLADPRNQRVWSIIVSLFGDLAQGRDARIGGGALMRILQPMEIRPEAIRVALHRLRKDGWIDSARRGRESAHFLTPYGRAQSARVSPRIYGPAPAAPDVWYVLIAGDGTGPRALEELSPSEDLILLGRTAALCPAPLPAGTDDLVVFRATPRSVPGWLSERLFPEALAADCADLLAALSDPALNPRLVPGLTPLQVATLRTLVVHRWRRVVLRQPDLPGAFCPPGWAGPACRARALDLLAALPRPACDALER